MDSTKDPLVGPRKFENLGLDKRECLDKIEDLVRKHRVEFERPPRPNAKLLVLDADCTLTCDDGKPRPYLQIMLSRVSEKYDIILWSHERDYLSSRLSSLNVFGSRYSIICYLNKKIKIEVNSNKYGTLCVKPLDFIWKNFPYDHRNTIMLDDKWQSYALNRQFGISTNRKDRSSNSENCELEAVANYLDIIAKLDDLSVLHHNDWKDNLDKKSPQGIPFLPPARIAHDDWTIEDITSESTITFTVVASFGDNEESNKIASDLSITEESDRSDSCDGSEVLSAEESEVKTDSTSSDADESKEFEVKVALKQPFRDDKKLLILDFQVLYDLRYSDHPCMLSARPYLREFLLRASENYDIAILTDRNIRFVEKGLRKFRIKKSGKCKISCIVEIAQDSVPERDVEYQRRICEAIWRGSGGYSDKNTVMAIDNSKYFHDSPLKVDIKSYTTKNIRMDIELGRLGAYLNQIASIEDFTILNHSMWREPERVFKYLESGDWGRSSREIDVQIKFWEETVNLERCDKDTSIGAIKEIVSGRIGISAEHQIFWFDMSQDYVAFEIIERQSVDQTRLRSPVPQILLLQSRGRYFEDNVQIHKWSTEDRILFAISCESDLHIPQLPIDSVAESSILTWKMDSITPESINDYPPVVQEIRPGKGWNHMYYSDGMEWLRDLSIEILNEPRPDKKLLILGGRFTLYASPLETDVWQKRPYLDDLLRRAYAYYDIAIWTDDGDEITKIMLENLGIMGDNKGYKIAFCLSNLWMFQMPSEFGTVNVKSLSIIWEKLPNYNEQNTIAVDSFDFFYLMHPKLLYQIETYRLENSETDRELRHLARHLELIATSDEFCELRGRNLLGPARIIYRDIDGVVRAKNRTDLIIKWRDNELIIKDIHIETTAQELKHMLADILNIPVPQILLEEYNEDVRNN